MTLMVPAAPAPAFPTIVLEIMVRRDCSEVKIPLAQLESSRNVVNVLPWKVHRSNMTAVLLEWIARGVASLFRVKLLLRNVTLLALW